MSDHATCLIALTHVDVLGRHASPLRRVLNKPARFKVLDLPLSLRRRQSPLSLFQSAFCRSRVEHGGSPDAAATSWAVQAIWQSKIPRRDVRASST